MKAILGQVLLSLSWLLHCARADFPYNPTTAFALSNNDSHLAYVFQPSSSSASSFQLLALNTSSTLDSTSLPYLTLSPTLPFLQNGLSTAFTPMLDDAGNISVYAGNCSSIEAGSSLWRFVWDDGSSANGTWIQQHHQAGDTSADSVLSGADFLGSGVSFTSHVGNTSSSPGIYLFGGMCPTAGSWSSSWVSSANYSNSLLALTPAPGDGGGAASSSPSTNYTVSVSQSKGPPIAEAGFSITPLLPSFLKSSDGSQDQQQNFVLFGGHTQTAFINTSQVALLSLPEESWTFLPVDPPPQNANTDLAVRQSQPDVEPRSGHTAVMTSDGKTIVVFGGWVGDTSTAANPQLVVLELGDGYGGTGSWQLSIPSQTGTGLASGAGIFGHGAVLLPGDVMMVVGGYTIPQAQGSKAKRAGPSQSTSTFFFNTSSNTWASTYTHPAAAAATSNKPAATNSPKSEPLSTSSKKTGLGVGLGLGIALIVAAIMLCWYCSRRHHRQRRVAREKEIRALGWTAQRFDEPPAMLGGADGRGAEKSAVDWMQRPGRDPSDEAAPGMSGGPGRGGFGEGPGWRENGATEAERTGLLVDIPSPTRGLRKSLHSRGKPGERVLSYSLAPGHDEHRRSLTGGIHPIDERAEYEPSVSEGTATGEPELALSDIMSTVPTTDPFIDPDRLRSVPFDGRRSPVSPARERELEVEGWVSDWSAADAIIHHRDGGRVSPDGHSAERDGTLSILSDTRSSASGLSMPPSQGTVSRSVSQRSASFFSANPFTSTNTSPTFDQAGPRNLSPHRRSHSMTMYVRPDSGDRASFMTARTNFPQLQSEGEALLPRPSKTTSLESSARNKSRGMGWMGSMRRALPFGGRVERSPSPSSSGDGSVVSSPTKYHGRMDSNASSVPARATSAGTMYWQRRQGAADWDAERSGGSSAAGMAREGEDEWDVEAAVERRVVQVMFTVPKEKLRVVNGNGEETDLVSNVDEKEEETGGDPGLAGLDKGKEKSVKGELGL